MIKITKVHCKLQRENDGKMLTLCANIFTHFCDFQEEPVYSKMKVY